MTNMTKVPGCFLAAALFGAVLAKADSAEAQPTDGNDWSASETSTLNGRQLEVIKHGVKPEWGYEAPQQDTFMVLHPKKDREPKTDREHAPLYVVLHAAGHDVTSCVECTRTVGNHDIYHAPEEFYALYLDCRANQGDWWWGGMHGNAAELIKRNSGGEPTPVEKRVIDTVKWAIKKYNIDANRVYLCGNSMGGSGALGIGMRNGDLFAAIKANVPAGIEHASDRMYFPPQSVPENVQIANPPVVIDYSAPNDQWSAGHDRFVKAMNDRRYPLYFYWGPFGHANNHAGIIKVNDLINSFDWLSVKRNEAYPVFANASCNNAIPWPDHLDDQTSGQVNAFFRWKNISDSKTKLEVSLFLTSPADLKTTFEIPKEATADVSLRRVQNMQVMPGQSVKWTFGAVQGEVAADATGLITIPGLRITATPATLTVHK